MFKTEPHLHVKEVSRCSRLTAAEMMSLYKNAGYTTVFVSDHLTRATIEAHFSGLSWREKVDGFFRGYEAARSAGEEIGIRVLPSAELTYNHSSNHYLLYGFDKLVARVTGIPTRVAKDPVSCVAIGTGISLDHLDMMPEGTINLSRERKVRL